ncbi:unnamed protein product, partial [Brenthis ino]
MTDSAAYKCVWIVTVLGERGGERWHVFQASRVKMGARGCSSAGLPACPLPPPPSALPSRRSPPASRADVTLP